MTNKIKIELSGTIFVLLTVMLVLLKIMNYIDIAWIWVFSPIWVPMGLALTIPALILVTTVLIILIFIALSIIVAVIVAIILTIYGIIMMIDFIISKMKK